MVKINLIFLENFSTKLCVANMENLIFKKNFCSIGFLKIYLYEV